MMQDDDDWIDVQLRQGRDTLADDGFADAVLRRIDREPGALRQLQAGAEATRRRDRVIWLGAAAGLGVTLSALALGPAAGTDIDGQLQQVAAVLAVSGLLAWLLLPLQRRWPVADSMDRGAGSR